jgi:hypothetical protein
MSGASSQGWRHAAGLRLGLHAAALQDGQPELVQLGSQVVICLQQSAVWLACHWPGRLHHRALVAQHSAPHVLTEVGRDGRHHDIEGIQEALDERLVQGLHQGREG